MKKASDAESELSKKLQNEVAENKEMLELLKEIEWGGSQNNAFVPQCPACGRAGDRLPYVHYAGCKLAAILRKDSQKEKLL
jgi:hypothetical protein